MKNKCPFIGVFTYYYKMTVCKTSTVYRKDKVGKIYFLDPNTFSKDGTTSLGGLDFSETVLKWLCHIEGERLEKSDLDG
jgi:hypothetical protein